LAFGLHAGNITPGLSAKMYFLQDYGIQAIGWWNNSGTGSYKSLEIRGIIVLVDSIAFDKPMNLYVAIGGGERVNSYKKPTDKSQVVEAVLGFEFHASIIGLPLAGMMTSLPNKDRDTEFSLLGGFGLILSLFDNAYIDGEVGIQRVIRDHKIIDYEGLKFSTGLHFYF